MYFMIDKNCEFKMEDPDLTNDGFKVMMYFVVQHASRIRTSQAWHACSKYFCVCLFTTKGFKALQLQFAHNLPMNLYVI